MMTVGVIALLCAAFGLYYNASSLLVSFHGAFSEVTQKEDQPYFYTAFYIMSVICIICYALLLWCGVEFVCLKFARAWLFTGLLVFEVVYFFCIGLLWMVPRIGMSVAGATGVANGGLMVQFIIVFPLWAPFVVHWARKRSLRAAQRI
jgi:hypothetical protein